MIGISTIRNAVNIDKNKHEKYQELSKGKDAPFSHMWQVFLVAACVGLESKQRVPLANSEKIFSWSEQLAADDLLAIVSALGIAATNDPLIVGDQEKLLTVIEEYANGGIDELFEELMTSKSERILTLAQLALSGGKAV
jgi:dnd system-associated protein 4